MTTTTYTTTYDSFVRQDTADTNYGPETLLRVRSNATSVARRSYLFFPVSLPVNAIVSSATLQLKLAAAWTGGTDTLTCNRVTASWKEGNITWSNQPTETTTDQATVSPNGAIDTWVSLDVTDIVQTWVAGASNYGFQLRSDLDTLKSFYSSEAAVASRPVLEVTYALPAEAPVDLAPDGGQAVSTDEPTFAWNSAVPSEINVQIDTVDTFDSMVGLPDYDSGWEAWTQTSFDTGDFASPPILVEGTTYYWRVRVRNADAVTSDWSGAAEFTYQTLGTLTITAPAADNDDVDTTSPTITHSFVDRTQAAVEYLLYEDGVLVYTRSKQATTGTSFEIPFGYVRDNSVDYIVTVRVWDDILRSSLGGADYVEASRTFQFVEDAAPDPVAAFTATADDGFVLLSFTRATEPDFFAVEVDGVIVHDRLPAADYFTAGTSYEIPFYRAIPGTSHTYKVHAVVLTGGRYKVPNDSPSAALTFSPIGVWLVDETDATGVCFLDAQVSAELGESGATFFPLATQAPVRITDIVRGLEGQVRGTLATTGMQTVAAGKANFEAMKGSVRHSLRLVYGYRNIPVVIGESELALDNTGGAEAYTASFDYWQVGDFDVEQV